MCFTQKQQLTRPNTITGHQKNAFPKSDVLIIHKKSKNYPKKESKQEVYKALANNPNRLEKHEEAIVTQKWAL
jgi:hypothetical protein